LITNPVKYIIALGTSLRLLRADAVGWLRR
jgi:hypothetical protein